MAISLQGIYSRLSMRIGLSPTLLHLFLWAGVASVSSLLLFGSIYQEIYNLLFDVRAQQSAGAYPLAMLLFLGMWLLINSDSIRDKLRMDVDGFKPLPTVLGVGLAALATVIAFNMLDFSSTWAVYIELLVIVTWFEALALIFANTTGLFALRYLALFVATASLQYIASTFLDPQVSFAFLSIFFPVLQLMQYPVSLNTSNPAQQLILVNRPDGGSVALWINSGCTGLPAISVFLLLAGLIYLDAKPKMKYFIPSVILGLVFTLALNMVRLTVLVQAALTAANVNAGYVAVEDIHSYIGYVIYSIFYVVYVFIMLRPGFRREEDNQHAVSTPADE